MTLLEAGTLIAALGGLTLGIYNTWRAHRRDQVRLRVVPKASYPVGPHPDPRPRMCIEVINVGSVATTIAEVGFLFRGTVVRGAITAPLIPGEVGSLPKRLEPGTAFTAHIDADEIKRPQFRTAWAAYAATATDQVVHGTSEALDYVAAAGEIPPPKRSLSRSDGLPGFFNVESFDQPSGADA